MHPFIDCIWVRVKNFENEIFLRLVFNKHRFRSTGRMSNLSDFTLGTEESEPNTETDTEEERIS